MPRTRVTRAASLAKEAPREEFTKRKPNHSGRASPKEAMDESSRCHGEGGLRMPWTRVALCGSTVRRRHPWCHLQKTFLMSFPGHHAEQRREQHPQQDQPP